MVSNLFFDYSYIILSTFLSLVGLVFSIYLITSNQPVYCVFFLILVFISSSSLLLMLETLFLSMVMVIVYVGAIAVLFLFVVMMFDSFKSEFDKSESFYISYNKLNSFLVYVVLFIYIFIEDTIIKNVPYKPLYNAVDIIKDSESFYISSINVLGDTSQLGHLVYVDYYFSFILASIVLLVSMVGAISLTLDKHKKSKSQNLFIQVSRQYFNSIKLNK